MFKGCHYFCQRWRGDRRHHLKRNEESRPQRSDNCQGAQFQLHMQEWNLITCFACDLFNFINTKYRLNWATESYCLIRMERRCTMSWRSSKGWSSTVVTSRPTSSTLPKVTSPPPGAWQFITLLCAIMLSTLVEGQVCHTLRRNSDTKWLSFRLQCPVAPPPTSHLCQSTTMTLIVLKVYTLISVFHLAVYWAFSSKKHKCGKILNAK